MGKIPPGPTNKKGNARDLQENILGFVSKLTTDYGHAVRYKFMLNFYAYQFTAPEYNKYILQENYTNFSKNVPAFNALKKIEGNGLVVSEGSFWQRQRRIMQPAFGHKSIVNFSKIMTDAATALVERWRPFAENNQCIDVYKDLLKVTLEIVSKALFSLNIADKAEKIEPAVSYLSKYVFEASSNPLKYLALLFEIPTPGNLELKEAMHLLNGIVNKIIKSRKGQEDEFIDLLSMLMRAKDPETGETMDEQQLHSEILMLMNAGHETTANAFAWALYCLSLNPEAEMKLHKELSSVLQGRVPTFEDLPNLKYTRMVIEESMRLFPPTYVTSRVADKEDEIGGYFVPKRAPVILSPYVTHRHPDFWDDPEVFRPERFSPEESEKREKFTYFPFGGGPHQCIGQIFAMTELQLVLATIAQNFRLKLQPGFKVEMEALISLRPKGAYLPMIIENY